MEVSDGTNLLHVMNIYVLPYTNLDMVALLSLPMHKAVIAGDFNAKLKEWGSPEDNEARNVSRLTYQDPIRVPRELITY